MSRLKWTEDPWGWSAPIPGAKHGETYSVTRMWNGRWDVGTSGKLPGYGPLVGCYGADRLYGGQPTHPSPAAAKRWTEARDHARWARLMDGRHAQSLANLAAGYLG